MADIFDNYVTSKSKSRPIIYAYSDPRYEGCLKVGYTADGRVRRPSGSYSPATQGQVLRPKVPRC